MKVLDFNLFKENSVQNGVAQFDKLQIIPCQGRRRTIDLNRTHYTIGLKKEHSTLIQAPNIQLMALNEREGEFSLELVCLYGGYMRYRIKSKCDIPFRLNGNLSYDALLEKGDQLQIGHNTLFFKNKTFKEDSIVPELIALSDLTILLEGETGCGKSHLAKQIHEQSKRKGEFVQLNLSTYNNSLIESEIFGHVKGAFTGAIREKEGLLSQANYGTLFLDEIDSISESLQIKLLLFLDNLKVRKIGGYRDKKVDVRLIFAANRNLYNLVKENVIRKDFYYRISSGHFIHVPSISEDSMKLKNIIFEKLRQAGVSISTDLLEAYLSYSWPGNYRQLLGHLKRKITLNPRGRLVYDSIDEELLANQSSESIQKYSREHMSLKEMKKRYIKDTYFKCQKSIVSTAKILKISPSTVRLNIGLTE
ncbi:MAG: sigma-54-dependent Fis family transcriptional regulator [Halobacteriovoraceae bacterium]|nr:sigma-54-dependent Fis family transcriptional regulator [Halobacteriovoraceae bacterium]